MRSGRQGVSRPDSAAVGLGTGAPNKLSGWGGAAPGVPMEESLGGAERRRYRGAGTRIAVHD